MDYRPISQKRNSFMFIRKFLAFSLLLFLCLILFELKFNLSMTKKTQKLHQSLQSERKSEQKMQERKGKFNQITKNINQVVEEESEAEGGKSESITPGRHLYNSIKSKFVSEEYFNITSVKKFKELPLCVIVQSEFYGKIQEQNYQNYHRILLTKNKMNYFELQDLIKRQCLERQLVLIVDRDLVADAFIKINNLFQKHKVWSAFIETERSVKIVGFYRELFFRVNSNDFLKKNKPFFQEINLEPVVLAMLELSQKFITQTSNLFKNETDFDQTLLSLQISHKLLQLKEKMAQYQPLWSLSQKQKILPKIEREIKRKILEKQIPIQTENHLLTLEKMKRVMEDVEIKNLPLNHSLIEREKDYMESTYNLDAYGEIPMCVVILSNNNVQNDRYKKVFYTLHLQNYSNYRVLFIDDASTDKTLQLTKKYAQQIGFPSDKISYKKNDQQKYATFNLKYAAFQFCKPQEVLVIVDGDDELIGRQVFRLISSFYQKRKESWIVYTSYFESSYRFGNSVKIPKQFIQQPSLYRKIPRHFMGPVRTFFTALFRKIKDEDHRYLNGNYFDTMYDQAMQKPMFEMAGNHITYIPEMCYFYNKDLPSSDHSTIEKRNHRKKAYFQLKHREKYERIKSTLTDQQKKEFQKQIKNLPNQKE